MIDIFRLTVVFTRRGLVGKVQKQSSIIAFICLHARRGRYAYGFARPEYSHSQGHSGNLQILE